MKVLSLGYSPCPNDTFIFYAMIHKKINSPDLDFRESLLDVETLNKKALLSELDVTKISYHAYGHLRNKYSLLRAGGALGRGCGPLIVAKNKFTMEELQGKSIAIPGRLTTAYLLLQLHNAAVDIRGPDSPGLRVVEMPFHRIIESVAGEKVDAGLIIHESRFTYPVYGLQEIIDLGSWWELETGLPIPLGCIVARNSLGVEVIRSIDSLIKDSVLYSVTSPLEAMQYIKEHSQELSDDVIRQHIHLYVNDFSIDPGQEGEKAVAELLSRAEKAGIIPEPHQGAAA